MTAAAAANHGWWLVCGALFAVSSAGCSAGGIDVIEVNPASLGNGLVAHWAFDDSQASVLSDRSGNDHPGQIVNPSWGAGQFDGALRFDGNSEVAVPSFPQPQRMSGWTVAGWLWLPRGEFGPEYLTLISTELLFMGGWQLNARETASSPDLAAGTIYQFGYWVGPTESDYFSFNCECVLLEQWVHLAAVVDPAANSLSFYRNGVLQGQPMRPRAGTQMPPITPGSPTLYMGRWPPNPTADKPGIPGRPLTGQLDDFVVYSRALAPREIQLLAHEALPRPY